MKLNTQEPTGMGAWEVAELELDYSFLSIILIPLGFQNQMYKRGHSGGGGYAYENSYVRVNGDKKDIRL